MKKISTRKIRSIRPSLLLFRADSNGFSWNNFQWKPLGQWTVAPDWNTADCCGGGLHGITINYSGYVLRGNRLVVCELDPKDEIVPITDNCSLALDKVKVPKAKIILVNDLSPLGPLTFIGRVCFSGTQITTLPNKLKCCSSLRLNHTKCLTSLPDDLHVNDCLLASSSAIKSIGKRLFVGEELDLSYTPIEMLPKNLRVGRRLSLIGCKRITCLPPDMRIGGSIDLTDSGITSLPPDLKVRGSLRMTGTKISTIPANVHVAGDVYLPSSVKSIGKNFQVRRLHSDVHDKLTIETLPEGFKADELSIRSGDSIKRLSKRTKIKCLELAKPIEMPNGITIDTLVLDNVSQVLPQKIKIKRLEIKGYDFLRGQRPACAVIVPDVELEFLYIHHATPSFSGLTLKTKELSVVGGAYEHLPHTTSLDKLWLSHCEHLKSLPTSKVTHWLSLFNLPSLTELPVDFIAGTHGSIEINNVPIKVWPVAIKRVAGNLVIRRTKITKLPGNLVVDGTLIVDSDIKVPSTVKAGKIERQDKTLYGE